jgi:ABC-type multidrug transport system fused ATPase/permease subunit
MWLWRRQRSDAHRRAAKLVRSTLRDHRGALASTVGLSVLLGFLPTIKSELEASIISEVDDGLGGGNDSLGDAFGEQVERVGGTSNDGIDAVVGSISSFLFDGAPLWRALLVYAAVVAVGYWLTVVSTGLRARVTRAFYTQLRLIGLRKALHFEPLGGQDDTNRAGRQAAAIQVGSSNVAWGYSSMLEAIQHTIVIVATLILVAGKSLVFAGSLLVFVALQLTVSWWQAKAMRTEREEFDKQRNELVGKSQDIIGKRDVILAHERGEHYERELAGMAAEYGSVEQKITKREEIFRGLVNMVTDSGRILVVTAALVIAVTTGSSAISNIGDAYFLIAIYFRLLVPAQGLVGTYTELRRAQATSREFLEILAGPDSPTPTADPGQGAAAPPEPPPAEAARFDDVDFTYPSSEDGEGRLVGTSFHLLAGQTNLIVGRSGCGKTTIARILLGFLRPDRGEVLVEGRPLDQWDPPGLRLRMSYVPQADQIVDDTVRANFFQESPDDDELVRVLRAVNLPRANAHESAVRGMLERRALELSGGQQQRLALARLLLDKAAIVILDEPLAGVDAFTFRDIDDELTQFLGAQDRTVVLISHRLAFAAYADHVVVLGDHGHVIEEGSREELVAREGVFHDLYLAAVAELLPDADEHDLHRGKKAPASRRSVTLTHRGAGP